MSGGGSIERRCTHCGDAFRVTPNRAHEAKFCSAQCRSDHHMSARTDRFQYVRAIGPEQLAQLTRGQGSKFWGKVNKSGPVVREGLSPCWEWAARIRKDGYGTFKVMTAPGFHKSVSAHRCAWMLTDGPIPAGMLVMHVCDNRACCNPSHLRLGTNADNMRDMAEKGRGKGGGPPRTRQLVERIVVLLMAGATRALVASTCGISRATVDRILRAERERASGTEAA